jgi:hypothetical protein
MIVLSDRAPEIEDTAVRAAACERAARLFKSAGMIESAKFAAAVHERAIDYIEQAPAIAMFVLPEDRKRKVAGGDRAYAAHRLAHYCRQGARLKEVMRSYGLSTPLRKLKGKALAPEDVGTLRLLASLPPSVVSQAIPNSITAQRAWLSAVGEWVRICHAARWTDRFNEWAVVQLARHKVRKSQVGIITDFMGRGDVPLNTAWEWPRAVAAADDWHDRLSAGDAKTKFGVMADQIIDRGEHPDHAVLYDYEFVALRTPTAIHAEGRAMHHCVASYVTAVLSGLTHIVSVRRDEQRVATLELYEGRIRQLKGRFNSLPAPGVLVAARQYADDVRAAKRLAA